LARKGFEGMAITPDGKTLYPMLEGALQTDSNPLRLIINQFDIRQRRYTSRQWFYRMESASHAIGDLTAITKDHFLVIERDGLQGDAAQFKKVFLVDLRNVDGDKFLIKEEVADLLNIEDPFDLAGTSEPFRFPFVTIESVIPLSLRTIGVLNDNNFPFSAGRAAGVPDNNEFIILRLQRPLIP
jgi:hypothetical protein